MKKSSELFHFDLPLEHPSQTVKLIAISPDSKILAYICSDNRLYITPLEHPNVRATITFENPKQLAIAPDNKTAMVVSGPDREGSKLWGIDLEKGCFLPSYRQCGGGEIVSLNVIDETNEVLIASDTGNVRQDAIQFERKSIIRALCTTDADIHELTCSPSGNHIAFTTKKSSRILHFIHSNGNVLLFCQLRFNIEEFDFQDEETIMVSGTDHENRTVITWGKRVEGVWQFTPHRILPYHNTWCVSLGDDYYQVNEFTSIVNIIRLSESDETTEPESIEGIVAPKRTKTGKIITSPNRRFVITEQKAHFDHMPGYKFHPVLRIHDFTTPDFGNVEEHATPLESLFKC